MFQFENPVAIIEWIGAPSGDHKLDGRERLHGFECKCLHWNGANQGLFTPHGKISYRQTAWCFQSPGPAMELQEALSKANQILDEERITPTVSYHYVPYDIQAGDGVGMAVMEGLASIAGSVSIPTLRNQRPREIQPPTWYRFKSTNYNLLCALLLRINESDRPGFVSLIALRLASAPGCVRKNHAVAFPGWSNFSSELPLVAEFLVRNHGKRFLFQALWEAETILGHGRCFGNWKR